MATTDENHDPSELEHPMTTASTLETYCPETYQPQNWAAVMRRVRELLQTQDEQVRQAATFLDRAERELRELEGRRAAPPRS